MIILEPIYPHTYKLFWLHPLASVVLTSGGGALLIKVVVQVSVLSKWDRDQTVLTFFVKGNMMKKI